MEQNLMNILFTALGIVITGLATWLSSVLVKFLNEKIKDKQLTKWLTQIVDIITSAVKFTYQTYVEELKDKDIFTKKAQEKALNQTYERVKNQLSKEAVKFIEENYGDVEKWIKEKIEAVIYSLKNLI